MSDARIALIVGAGSGLSAALARKARSEGLTPLLAARDIDKLAAVLAEVGGEAKACDASDPKSVAAAVRLGDDITRRTGTGDL
jgi:NADP-dependent 3-hydroxy acid dehydrogenase YdfG